MQLVKRRIKWIIPFFPMFFVCCLQNLKCIVAVVNGDSSFLFYFIDSEALLWRHWWIIVLLATPWSNRTYRFLFSVQKNQQDFAFNGQFRINIIIMNTRTNASINSILSMHFTFPHSSGTENDNLSSDYSNSRQNKQRCHFPALSWSEWQGIYVGNTYKWNSIYSMAAAALYEAFE